ncbi:phosphopantetheine-binding protein [Streptomyces palmae]|uniref:phosphopantetheine-binding protein n=1 Tax=Streptomyces palmae TaxID=1701085 RepID=UPI001AE0161A|nr:phosphopantetheine-binding protein [Streptomyces palmae]
MTAATPSPAVPTDDEVLATLRKALTEVLDAADLAQVDLDAIDRDTPLLSLPLDSLTLVAAMSFLETSFRVFIPEQKAFAFKKVGELVDFVREKAETKAAKAAKAAGTAERRGDA